ncbi:hypothetical protein GALMADRAFT_240574, partial [Galerina marginata CBS 339.88]
RKRCGAMKGEGIEPSRNGSPRHPGKRYHHCQRKEKLSVGNVDEMGTGKLTKSMR